MTDALKPCPFCGSEPGTLARPDNIDGTEFYAAVFCHCEGYSATAHAGRRRKTQDEATAAAHAAWNRRAALAAPAVPPGWQLVPVEPTPEMLEAVKPFPHHLTAEHPDPADPWHRRMAAAHKADQIGAAHDYRAMLAAAPGAPDAPQVPEGCTPADAAMLRRANHGLAGEVHMLQRALADLHRQVQEFVTTYGEADFYTGAALAVLAKTAPLEYRWPYSSPTADEVIAKLLAGAPDAQLTRAEGE